MRNEAEDFVVRLLKRRPELREEVTAKLGRAEGIEGTEGAGPVDIRALETIVSEQRPVFFAGADGTAIDLIDAAVRGEEARYLKEELQRRQAVVAPLLNRIGRIDVEG